MPNVSDGSDVAGNQLVEPQTSEQAVSREMPSPVETPAIEIHEERLPQDTGADVSGTSPSHVYRHAVMVRLAHWLNALCIPILIMSGFQIFNAHQALYWGERSDRDRPLFSIQAVRKENGDVKGVTTILGHAFDTTGVLGVSDGSVRGFPSWATIPSGKWLAMGRQWHLFFAWVFVLNGLLFGFYAVAGRHFWRNLFPKWKDLRGIGRDLVNHLRFRHPTGDEARHYNVMQKLAYTGVMFGLGPLIVLTGLTMSPAIDAAFPWLTNLFGGRQSARTIHFVVCFAFIGFVVVHLLMVATTGLYNNIRSMITGWFRIRPAHEVQNER
ncbi:MAG TPA: cytochrome b/b6 domain-containing protein [Nitrospiraceae bacterium]|nr:cytochrome b/b6 domain-containing protein [Nitrospiraceae bacterium]